jgi:hypothetical protein
LCGTDHFGNLGIYEERIINLILERGREEAATVGKQPVAPATCADSPGIEPVCYSENLPTKCDLWHSIAS